MRRKRDFETKKRFENGREVAKDVFDRRWRVTSLRADRDIIELRLEAMDLPEINAIGEESLF